MSFEIDGYFRSSWSDPRLATNGRAERQSGVAEDEGLKVPAAPSDLDWFADDMNRSVEESAQQRREAIEAQTR